MINQAYLAAEPDIIKQLLCYLKDYNSVAIQHLAQHLVLDIRNKQDQQTLVEAFLHEYQLNSEEGIVLMSIAEALLRIPDHKTQDLFLQEKLTEADWHKHLQNSDSLLVNFATQALAITGQIEQQLNPVDQHNQQIFSNLCSRIGFPLIRSALKQAMQQLAFQFVIAENIDKAIVQSLHHSDYLYSFDMLGESAITTSDEERYFNAYTQAIEQLAKYALNKNPNKNPGISIKLSALYCRYEPLQHKQAVQQIAEKLLILVSQARIANIPVTIDAEETERLNMSLDIFNLVITDSSVQGWSGLGLAVQAYQLRASSTLHWVIALAQSLQCKIPVRLVKGAYWDSEIKRTQVNGIKNYPVFTSKQATDVSYLACSTLILSYPDEIYPQFATHNAHTLAAILTLAENHPGYEFQRLHGMGEQLYRQLLKQTSEDIPCRIYAPVGNYQDLLPYLVRRLLENGANTSFINQVENPENNIDKVIADPVIYLTELQNQQSQIPLPSDLYGKNRKNSEGINLANPEVLKELDLELKHFNNTSWHASPIVNGQCISGTSKKRYNPANNQMLIGDIINSKQETIENAINSASSAYKHWRLSTVQQRAISLQKTAELIEQNRAELVSLCVREGGKTIKDALSEIRETVDFCRYYAQSAIELFDQPLSLAGPTGESNLLYQYGRGIFVCISPWNFPIAIFMGQITAALVSGNAVIAKPATQTPLTAMRCIQLLHQAGIPKDVLQFLPGDGASMSEKLISDSRIAGVAFTGSLSTAQLINQQLSKLPAIIPLIAETGGQNVMIADSSAHSEQLIQDALQSAFNSAGQRCSALRVLYIPHEIADQLIARIIGAMQHLIIGDPQNYQTDIGPVISQNAAKQLADHVAAMKKKAKVLFQLELPKHLDSPGFFPPTLIELTSLSQLKQENFGPILHIIKYRATELNHLIDDVNKSGYGLTLGIHSRINNTINIIVKNCKVGNIYINRNIISAVVGVQPFGGMGLSGTGPKAGGPNYLQRFTSEQTITTNTAAIGGNAQLLTKET